MKRQTHLSFSRGYFILLGFCFSLTLLFFYSIYVLFTKGVGIWGITMPVAWGFAITNFIWWIGIGHAGTFISAILFLTKQEWRIAISRLAETMTIFAVICAGLFPVLHVGRPWMVYWFFPYVDTMKLWPQFRSPLIWDFFAVSTYLVISTCYWFLGLVPDLAIYRDRAKTKSQQQFYGVLALGWRGSNEQWKYYRTAYLLLAGLAAPLVISVHSIVGLDFGASLVSGWHSTIFPPYFVAGAIYSGFAMVLTLAIPIRKVLHLEDTITPKHLDLCARFLLGTGMLVTYGYFVEAFLPYMSGDARDIAMIQNRFFGSYAFFAWLMIFCNVGLLQLLWFKRVRASAKLLFIISIGINVGMWFERFIIIVTSLYRDDLPSSWHFYKPTFWDYSVLFGSLGFFAFNYLVFARFFPIISISELAEKESK
jgi:Ni/Fe-hydrogenase subunit HybB-like protein